MAELKEGINYVERIVSVSAYFKTEKGKNAISKYTTLTRNSHRKIRNTF